MNMGLSDQDLYQGALLVKIIKQLDAMGYKESYGFSTGTSKSSFLLKTPRGDCLGIYIKYTKKQRSPWSYSFSKSHRSEIDGLNNNYKNCFIAFVCGCDGIAFISYSELKELLDDNFEDSERVGITRKIRGSYWLKGRNGALGKSINRNEIGKKIINEF